MFANIYKGKKVLVTGHTGFKGSWLTSWLLKLGAQVCGVSKDIPTQPSMFEELGLADKIDHNFIDIRSLDELRSKILDFQPDFLFHMAAQPIVSTSYEEPIDTITSNVLGTANVLESIRSISKKCAVIIITSDKCYENVEWVWGYKETDAVGGKDIYSASKGAAEVIFHSYSESFFKNHRFISIASARAGNVIGGGDWAKDRIVVDCFKNWNLDSTVQIRSPNATRPWQHVLEPLSGYLHLGQHLYQTSSLPNGESFNFGPRSEQNRKVTELIEDLSKHWNFNEDILPFEVTDNIPFHEAGLLKLNCDKALFHLKWEPNLYYKECVDFVGSWYADFYSNKENASILTDAQIERYEQLATERNLIWTR
ncbi:CDP-glucose 4,6-dehydratase [Vibrio barjaei]|uniref:CDP-glucose 4,6-dehydratase n=1 Tax=Vibrio barjaei TaxID=1676683 RepID=UPI0007BB3C23|nr:CDP-glucose 4,6-dehydratase [Vibrio barjaei]OIN25464.1 CDP-glucose 4,6-dehydratase [Vibrio barjaei]